MNLIKTNISTKVPTIFIDSVSNSIAKSIINKIYKTIN